MTKNRTRYAVVGLAALLVGISPVSGQVLGTVPVTRVSQGTLVGRYDGAVEAFLGVPYAAPPIGRNRWRAPQAPSVWKGARQASDYGASCVQQVLPGGRPPWTVEYMVQGRVSEDCLTLNVWTPATSGKRPVLVWIHGGGFQEGSGAVPIYRGAALAGRDIVVVSINYRLGVFGFLAHPELTREGQGGPVSNFGLQDQIAALKWVRGNVAAFGGDPDQVTIAGQSAGSMAVHSLVASPLAKGLFIRAIAQSGLPGIMPIPSLAQSEQNGLAFARDKGAAGLAQLRAMSPSQLALAPGTVMGGKYQFGPLVDGRLLPASPSDMTTRGSLNDVPMMVGQTADEGSAFPGYGAGDVAAYEAFMRRSFGEKAQEFGQFYSGDDDAARSRAVREASRDRGLAMIGNWALAKQGKSSAPVWSYFFNHAEPGEGTDKFGAFHSSEIPYVFATLDMAPSRNFTVADRQLSLAMSSYWVNFVKTGNPNGRGLATWPQLTTPALMVLEFNSANAAARPLLSPEKLAAYRAYVARGGQLSMF